MTENNVGDGGDFEVQLDQQLEAEQDSTKLGQFIRDASASAVQYRDEAETTDNPYRKRTLGNWAAQREDAVKTLTAIQEAYSDLENPSDVIDRLGMLIDSVQKNVDQLCGIRDEAARGNAQYPFTEADARELNKSGGRLRELEAAQSYYLERLSQQ